MTATETRGHNAPCSNRDFDFFYRGLESGRLLAQRCSRCATLRSLPSPACGQCQSLEWEEFELSGEGRVFSYTIHHHPPLPGFAVPHPVVLVDMIEGVRLLGPMDGTPPDEVAIGMSVRADFTRRGDVAAFRFRKA
ncbi:Zn-ribbon domain-containing OB-fold protein [Novosphingobium rosa]|uniref:Zn-ribbon domain-containing OB-fold protein n=1 Tax=Novosphingobium rosa TaxID=76978 RepID=UPI000A03B461|nr:Zn-ribbon domain-containing OB-fold protein [Novosphingobium rosa]